MEKWSAGQQGTQSNNAGGNNDHSDGGRQVAGDGSERGSVRGGRRRTGDLRDTKTLACGKHEVVACQEQVRRYTRSYPQGMEAASTSETLCSWWEGKKCL